MNIQIPASDKKRVVIVGGGFGGIALANRIDERLFQTVLIDRCNYHQFQPLLYQVASSGLDPGSISFPFRKLFAKKKDFYFRLAEVREIVAKEKRIETSIGSLNYDYLVVAVGTTTNFFGNEAIAQNALPMKSVEEALELRNALLTNLEKALDCTDLEEKQALVNVAIVGGGATGVEIAGVLSEMRRYILPKDYPHLSHVRMNIYLVEGSDRVLAALSPEASANALRFLKEMGVEVILNKMVVNYADGKVVLDDGSTLSSETLIWVSGVISEKIGGIAPEAVGRGGRLLVNEYNQLQATDDVFVIGDSCLQKEEAYPNGHPQVAPVAIQQGRLLADNLKREQNGKQLLPFRYKNQGSLATIGRNKAVADLKSFKLHGFVAWAVWMLVHLRSILGVRNKIMVLFDWVWSYFTYDQSMRFILYIRPRKR